MSNYRHQPPDLLTQSSSSSTAVPIFNSPARQSTGVPEQQRGSAWVPLQDTPCPATPYSGHSHNRKIKRGSRGKEKNERSEKSPGQLKSQSAQQNNAV